MARLIKKDGRLFIELPEALQNKPIKAIKLEQEIFVVASEDAIKRLLERQLRYVMTRRVKERLVKRGGKEVKAAVKAWDRDYAIIQSDEAARAFSREHAMEFKRGEILGVKGFDGKYYVVRADTYTNTLERVINALQKGPATVKELAGQTKLEEGLIKAVLEIAKEDGLVYEGKDGRYHYAG